MLTLMVTTDVGAKMVICCLLMGTTVKVSVCLLYRNCYGIFANLGVLLFYMYSNTTWSFYSVFSVGNIVKC